MAASRKASATRCWKRSSTTRLATSSHLPWPTICRRPHTRFRSSSCITWKLRARIRSRRPKALAKAVASARRQPSSTRSTTRWRRSAWRWRKFPRRRSVSARRCARRRTSRDPTAARTLFFTLPLVGRVDTRSVSGWGSLQFWHPHPRPLPTGGRGERRGMTGKTNITLTINGHDHAIAVEPRRTLVDAIREDCGQTGTHIGCEHGVCGACTVIVDGEPVRSCLMFAAQADGKKIRTVEGLADGDKLHPMQQAFMDHHGLQCGFCTPGFLMLAVGVLEREPDIGDDDLIDVLSSNLCRCTGYQNIIKAVRAAAKEMRGK